MDRNADCVTAPEPTTTIEKVSWILAFHSCANWEITPWPEREYDENGRCLNMSRQLGPEHPQYTDPFAAYEAHYGHPPFPEESTRAEPH